MSYDYRYRIFGEGEAWTIEVQRADESFVDLRRRAVLRAPTSEQEAIDRCLYLIEQDKAQQSMRQRREILREEAKWVEV